ncbi:unnamed protein product [Calicophoron daubneyi]|uniref:Pecanex-like protein n=1 Tax=Calicophoron daubneyi TaxID=300641 RepID=A0AAV2T060_CALDB
MPVHGYLRMVPKIVREDFVSSLTGGFYFDYTQTHFVNIVHLYLWIVFFISPLITYLIAPDSAVAGLVYSIFICIITTIIKLLTWRVHRILDTNEPIAETREDRKLSVANAGNQLSYVDRISGTLATENTKVAEDIEEQCRRIGQAGLDIADIGDAFERNQRIVPRPLSSVLHPVTTADCIGQSTPVAEIKSTVLSDPRHSADPSIKEPAASSSSDTQRLVEAVASTSSKVCSEESEKYSVVPENNQDKLLPTDDFGAQSFELVVPHFKENMNVKEISHSAQTSTAASKTSHRSSPVPAAPTTKRQSSATAISFQPDNSRDWRYFSAFRPSPHLSSHTSPRGRLLHAPTYPRPLDDSSWPLQDRRPVGQHEVKPLNTAAYEVKPSRFFLAFPSDIEATPTSSGPTSSQDDIEVCKQIIRQLKVDVAGLPIRSRDPFTPSLKDLETLDLYPKTRPLTCSISRARSSSQRHPHPLLASIPQKARNLTPVTHLPSAILSRQQLSPNDVNNPNLADAVLLWRRQFANRLPNSSLNRTNRSQSFRHPTSQAVALNFDLLTLNTSDCRHRNVHNQWRSHSLRYTDFPRTQPFSRRHPPRRPGSFLRQQHPQLIEPPPPTVSSDASGISGSLPVSSAPPSPSETPDVPKAGAADDEFSHSQASAIMTLSAGASAEVVEQRDNGDACVDAPSNKSEASLPTEDDKIKSSLESGAHHGTPKDTLGTAVEGAKSSLRSPNNRLVRQRGIRRKHIVPPAHTPPLACDSEHPRTDSSTPLPISRTEEQCVSSCENNNDKETKSEWPRIPVTDSSSLTSPVPCASTSNSGQPTAISTEQTIENVLAQLMGVRSLKDAGLSREQCLAQLRGAGDTEDSEKAEWDILFAITMATEVTSNALSSTPIRPTDSTSTLAHLFQECTEDVVDEVVAEPVVTSLADSSQGISAATAPNSNAPISSSLPSRQVSHELGMTNRGTDGLVENLLGTDAASDTVRAQSTSSLVRRLRPSALYARDRTPGSHLYQVPLIAGLPIFCRIRLDRLQVDSLFDRCRSLPESLLCIALSFTVGFLGHSILRSGKFHDFGVLACCFAVAGCHYSLIKSVQPDAASPQHGFNRIIVYSRSAFFSIIAVAFIFAGFWSYSAPLTNGIGDHSLDPRPLSVRVGELSLVSGPSCFSAGQLLIPFNSPPVRLRQMSAVQFPSPVPKSSLADHLLSSVSNQHTVKFFAWILSIDHLIDVLHLICSRLVVLFPLLFLFGLVPQMNTLLTYMLEQWDIHVFGGSGSAGLLSACFSVFRAFVVLYSSSCICYLGVKTNDPRHFLFSIFWGIHVSLCYLLSRLPSDVNLYVILFTYRGCNLQLRSRIQSLLSSLVHLSCLKIFKPKSTYWRGKHCNCIRGCRQCGPHFPWSKVRKPKSDLAEPVVWWRNWIPFLSNIGLKSSLRPKIYPHTQVGGMFGRVQQYKTSDESTSWEPLIRSLSERRITDQLAGPEVHLALSRTCHSAPSIACWPNPDPLKSEVPTSIECPSAWPNVTPPSDIVTDVSKMAACENKHATSDKDDATHQKRLEKDDTVGPLQVMSSKTGESATGGTQSTASPTRLTSKVRYLNENVVEKQPSYSPSSSPKSPQPSQSTCSATELERRRSASQQHTDPLPGLIYSAMIERFKNDLICVALWIAVVIGLNEGILTRYPRHQPLICRSLIWITIAFGSLLHYIWPNLRKSYPWLCFTRPPVAPQPQGELVGWEVAYYWCCWLERNVLVPLVTVLTVSQSTFLLVHKFGELWACVIIATTSMKMLRNGFSAASRTFVVLFFCDLLFTFDFPQFSETFSVNYFVVAILLSKTIELIRKLHFVYIYTAPFRVTWGSVIHAILQIAFIPHAMFMLGNCLLSTLISSPLEPFLASAIFITSYVRPIKFWEITHRTERIETTNTSLAAQMHGVSEEQVLLNLNAIFYESLTRSLQLTLAGDIQLGRLGGLSIGHGDIFILGSDDLNLAIHIIEVANGLVTFQLRGLEFMRTYCHEHETEALRSNSHNDAGCCCFNPGHCPGLLSFNAALRMRCMTWQFIYGAYSVEGYRMTSHSADTVVQLNDLRKVLVSRFVQCIIYYVLELSDLPDRLNSLTPNLMANNFFTETHFDLDPVFLKAIDDDFDNKVNGVTRRRFVDMYLDWIQYCLSKHPKFSSLSCEADSPLVTLCYALSILGRRCMGGVQAANYDVNQVLRGIHDIFKGDVHVVTKDDWVLSDIDLLQAVITPAMRIALKLYQDNFLWASEFSHNELYRKIQYTEKNFVICLETDPNFRFAVLNDANSLFSIRWVGLDPYNIIRFIHLTKAKLQFCAVKINPECVRGLWAGQQREQIFIRNTNPERGSIQGAQHVLRNLVNSSCDPPIGYPIYVSPLLTSFVGTNSQYCRVAGPELSITQILIHLRRLLCRSFSWCRKRIWGKDKTDGGMELSDLPNPSSTSSHRPSSSWAIRHARSLDRRPSAPGEVNEPLNGRWPSLTESITSVQNKKALHSDSSHLTTLAALVHQQCESDALEGTVGHGSPSAPNRVKIIDPSQILNDRLNKLTWPSAEWLSRCLTHSACYSSVYPELEAVCIHRWTPSNPETNCRSFCHRTICLLAFPDGPPLLDGHYVAIWEDKGVEAISAPNESSFFADRSSFAELTFASNDAKDS